MASHELPHGLALSKKKKEAVDGLNVKQVFSIAALQEARHEVAW
jgi:hypothetical protein